MLLEGLTCEDVNWIELVLDHDKGNAVVGMVMNIFCKHIKFLNQLNHTTIHGRPCILNIIM